MKNAFSSALLIAVYLSLAPAIVANPPLPSSSTARALFNQPSRDYSSGPLWVWNDRLSEEQIRHSIRSLADQEIRQVWVHPRPGLMTPYLSAEWFRMWQVTLDEAQRLDMNVWIYDENSYPSGFAGGWVPELMPESRGRGLHFAESDQTPAWRDDVLAVFLLRDEEAVDVTDRVRDGVGMSSEGRYLTAVLQRAADSPWYGGRSYVDLLFPGVTEKFLEVTLEPYRERFGGLFGERIPGSFTDEPHLRPAGGLPWTEDLAEQFQARWGYHLISNLASLHREVGDWRRVRHNYYQVLNDLFIERWAKPYHDYCARYGLEMTGHYWEHEWPNCRSVPDNMALYAWQQRPGIDTLMNQYQEHTHAQFGNVRAVRELASVANQLGRSRTLCEAYGAGGWDLRLEDMKRIGDWLYVLGVNTLNQHLSYVTLRGARKRDHPQSFSYHAPWWEAYHTSAQYFARLSAALSHGQQINPVLVIEPTTTAWMYQGSPEALTEKGTEFFDLLMRLEAAQAEYDLGSEDIVARHGRVTTRALHVGRRAYQTVVLPPGTENLNERTWELLVEFLAEGGTLLSSGSRPLRIDGTSARDRWTGDPQPLLLIKRWKRLNPSALLDEILAASRGEDFSIHRMGDDAGLLFHHRRQFSDGQLLFLVNSSSIWPSRGEILAEAGGVEEWVLNSGRTISHPFTRQGRKISIQFDLPPCGSLLLFLSNEDVPEVAPPEESDEESVAPLDPMDVVRLEPNVLTLDYVDLKANGKTWHDIYFYEANGLAFQSNGLARNPWDSAVQFKDELTQKSFPPESGFEVRYRFRIESQVPGDLRFVVERPDLYSITCNGTDVVPDEHEWWLDRSFHTVALSGRAVVGENVVTLKAAPFTIEHEIEAAYVIGSFRLRPAEKGFVITPDAPLRVSGEKRVVAHDFHPDGTMWLSAGIGYPQNHPSTDRNPYLIFDLGRPVDLGGIEIWNYNESHVRDLTRRGVKQLRILGSRADAPVAFQIDLGTFELDKASRTTPAESISATARGIRYVLFDITSNHSGVHFPASGTPPDHGFVGLSEVRFLDQDGDALNGVSIQSFSSQLVSHNRLAEFVLDGSGIAETAVREGWNEQGHPFYADGVSYGQSYRVDSVAGPSHVRLGSWYGSAAQVVVNGSPAGYITHQPYECDVSDFIKPGTNEVQVVILGTLKNTLGPHHGSPPLGSAWPAMFQRAPEPGPPPGAQYHTVAYGLFEPFSLTTSRSP